MKFTLIILVACLAAFPAVAAAGQTPDSLFSRGCDLYEAGEFTSALDAFESAGRGGIENAALYYNLGNTYYRLDSQGRAVANYRRAQMLDPRGDDIEAPLKHLIQALDTRKLVVRHHERGGS